MEKNREHKHQEIGDDDGVCQHDFSPSTNE